MMKGRLIGTNDFITLIKAVNKTWKNLRAIFGATVRFLKLFC